MKKNIKIYRSGERPEDEVDCVSGWDGREGEEGGRSDVRFGIFQEPEEGSYSLDSAPDTQIPEFKPQPFKVHIYLLIHLLIY